ncbi:MAG: hypothetical protein CL569_03580 [Alphaproteobacteria bacterium]|nr:hypothetical protein [Alphaproteobacteria bacterium]
MTAYWMARVNLTDADVYGEYAKLAGPAIEKHGGRFLARGGESVTLEGEDFGRNVVIQFDSVEQAVAAYNSPEYKEALEFSSKSSIRNVCIVDGVD